MYFVVDTQLLYMAKLSRGKTPQSQDKTSFPGKLLRSGYREVACDVVLCHFSLGWSTSG